MIICASTVTTIFVNIAAGEGAIVDNLASSIVSSVGGIGAPDGDGEGPDYGPGGGR